MHNPTESEADYIDKHIRDELKYLLCGAKVWQLLEKKDPVIGEDNMHLQVHMMTSCFVRIRNLYLYFTQPKRVSIQGAYNYSFPQSKLFATDKKTIEAKVMHLNPAKQRESKEPINEKILLYTDDILGLIADHLDNLEKRNPTIYKVLLKVTKDCYNEANTIVYEKNVFGEVARKRIEKHFQT